MPLYIYKAVTKSGDLVRNRVEAINKYALLNKLKDNNLLPIEVIPIKIRNKSAIKKVKKNVETSNSVLKAVRNKEIEKNINSETFGKKLKKALTSNVNGKISDRDIVIFTENFYLLKKANFNNIHALTTIIETTDNASLKGILEDVLLGVEAGDNMYTTLEYYSNVFSPIYINMIKVGELSGSLVKALEEAKNYLEDSMELKKKIKSVLVPNIIEFVALLLLLVVGTVVGVPLLQGVFESTGSTEELPAITLWFAGVLNRNSKILVYSNICNYCISSCLIYVYINSRGEI